MRVTREEYCWKCHKQMDPLGLPFEMFDHFGRFRTTEQGQPVDTAAALALVPVVEVAWADAKIQDGERAAILGEAKTDYGFAHPESRPLLEYWLKNRPTPQMMTAWVHFVRALGRMLSPGDQDDLRDSLIHLCRGVAEADGGVFGKVSGSEKKVLEQIQAAFDREQSA